MLTPEQRAAALFESGSCTHRFAEGSEGRTRLKGAQGRDCALCLAQTIRQAEQLAEIQAQRKFLRSLAEVCDHLDEGIKNLARGLE